MQKRRLAILTAVTLVPVSVSWARLPGTLNFADVTSTHITSTIAETNNNEKEVEFGDYDNDGDLDVAVADGYSAGSSRRNKLYRNDGDGHYMEVSGAPVIPGFSTPDVSRTAFFRDYDEDGWLDLVIVNDDLVGGEAGRSKYYRNAGDTFIEEGVARFGTSGAHAACGAASMDHDHDGDFDIYFGNYPGPSQDEMLFNDGNGMFTNMTGPNLPTDSDYTVDVVGSDMNGDGKIDVIKSSFTPDLIVVYNDLPGSTSTGLGDYDYSPGAEQILDSTSASEHAAEPIDVNGDGRMDIYATNRVTFSDRVLLNTGNGTDGKVIWDELPANVLPPSALDWQGGKASVMDLNGDGRPDVFRGSDDQRPSVLRNVTVEGDVRFIDWTPSAAFPAGSVHRGWHGGLADVVGDNRPDIFHGGWVGEHLFENVASAEFDETTTSFDEYGNALAIFGSSTNGDAVDTFTFNDVPAGASMSVVLTAGGDYLLEVLDGSGVVVADSDRGGSGVEEALQIGVSSGYQARVTMQSGGAGDTDGDGDVDLNDFNRFQLCFTGPGGSYTYGCLAHDYDADGDVDLADFNNFSLAFGQPIDQGQYLLEVLIRVN